MTPASQLPLVSTIGERCRVCYQCVRECPAKAIRIADHRAQVIPERCIGCGVCYKVCTQDAKKILSAVDAVEALLDGPVPVAAILAVPVREAQAVADHLVAAGVRSFLNFAPLRLRVPPGIFVDNMDMTTALDRVAYYARQRGER